MRYRFTLKIRKNMYQTAQWNVNKFCLNESFCYFSQCTRIYRAQLLYSFSGKPFPVRNCTLTNQTSNSVEVSCLPGFDGGLPQHFLLELYTANSVVPRYNVTAPEPYFFLDNLEPDVTFRIAVFAVNGKGRSHGVVLEEVTFRDAEKRTGK